MEDFSGKTIGNFLVIKYVNNAWECHCKTCGNVIHLTEEELSDSSKTTCKCNGEIPGITFIAESPEAERFIRAIKAMVEL